MRNRRRGKPLLTRRRLGLSGERGGDCLVEIRRPPRVAVGARGKSVPDDACADSRVGRRDGAGESAASGAIFADRFSAGDRWVAAQLARLAPIRKRGHCR